MKPSTPTDQTLLNLVDQFSVQAVVSSRHLQSLYRGLKDDRQAVTAAQAAGQAEERLMRLGLSGRTAALAANYRGDTQDPDGERKAWGALVEAQAGLAAFYSLAEHLGTAHGLGSGQRATTKAFHKSLTGLRVAFPEEHAEATIDAACDRAADLCASTIAKCKALHTADTDESIIAILREDIRRALATFTELPKVS